MARNESFLRRFGQAFTDSLHQSMGGLPFWFRIPVGMALHFPPKTSVGHPDILRALILTRLHFYEVDSSDRKVIDGSIKEGFTFFWDWLNSPSLIPKQFGPLAHLYLRLYSLSSISDLSIIPGFHNEFSPLEGLRRVLRHDVEELCSQRNTNDHRAWGFRVLLLWSYLCSPTKEASADELKDLLLSIIDVGGDFRDGFCVYWAALFAVADDLVGSDS